MSCKFSRQLLGTLAHQHHQQLGIIDCCRINRFVDPPARFAVPKPEGTIPGGRYQQITEVEPEAAEHGANLKVGDLNETLRGTITNLPLGYSHPSILHRWRQGRTMGPNDCVAGTIGGRGTKSHGIKHGTTSSLRKLTTSATTFARWLSGTSATNRHSTPAPAAAAKNATGQAIGNGPAAREGYVRPGRTGRIACSY